MNNEFVISKKFVSGFFLVIVISTAVLFLMEAGEYAVIIPVLGLIFMLHTIYAIYKLKAGKILSFLFILFVAIGLIWYSYTIFFMFVSLWMALFYDVYQDGDFEFKLVIVIFLMSPVVVSFLEYLLVVFISHILRKRNKKRNAEKRVGREWYSGRKKLGEICSGYPDAVILFICILFFDVLLLYVVLTRSSLNYMDGFSFVEVVTLWGFLFVSCLLFIIISLYVIYQLCRQRGRYELFLVSLGNDVVFVLIAICEIFVYFDEERLEEMGQYVLVLNIPIVIMLVLFLMAKRMARHSSGEIEVVKEVEHITSEKAEDSVEWKMEVQPAAEPEKKPETRMEEDF